MRDGVEILWDEWGVPHVYAGSDEDAVWGLGWAQGETHGTLLLELYGLARGQAAQHWGEEFRDEDVTAWTLGLPALAPQVWDAQSAESRARLTAFAEGVNACCAAHPDHVITRHEVLPITGLDIVAHVIRDTFHFTKLAGDRLTKVFPPELYPAAGSNAWAVSPERSTTGNALLICNPHLPWSGRYRFFEAHSVSPGRDFYGACLVGHPYQLLGFNDVLGWSHTVNPISLFNAYSLVLSGDGYVLDGEVQEFETSTHVLQVKGREDEVLELRRTVHGPVVLATDGAPVALRIAAVTSCTATGWPEVWWQMSKARDLDTLLEATRTWQMPMQNLIAASSEGRVAASFCGMPPVRSQGTFAQWVQRLPGDDSSWIWTDVHPQRDLPLLVDPQAGYVQNSNDPPWTYTWPMEISPDDHPRAVSGGAVFPGFRSLVANEPFTDGRTFALDELIALKYSTAVRVAEHVLDDLIDLARAAGLDEAAKALEAWDRKATADSRGAVLFFGWFAQLELDLLYGKVFAEPWSAAEPFTTPRGLKDPARAVEALRAALDGAPDARLGDVWTMRSGGVEVEADGGPSGTGVLKALTMGTAPDGSQTAVFGDTVSFAVEFSAPMRAEGIMIYGNATEPSRADGRQLALAAQSRMRTLHLSRDEVLAHPWIS